MTRRPEPGQTVWVGGAASVQFAGRNGFNFRVIRVENRMTYVGWVWLEGYVLGPGGEAVDRRMIFVRAAGLKPARP